jgi:hypothetical protein
MATTNVLDSVLSQYEKTKQNGNSTGNKLSQEDRLKRYFAAILPKGEKQGQKRLRILPTNDGSSPFKEAWFHEIYLDGKTQKFYDPEKNDNERSPLNEVYEDLRSTGKDSDKKLAEQYRTRKFYVVKVIDRDNEQDGPKFWRFKHNYKNEGVLDKIIPLFRSKGDITDVNNGRDIILELATAKSPKGGEYTVIQTVMYEDPAPLHDITETSTTWANDETTWRDVYSKKPVEYLEAIARGETPRWDSEQGKYVYGDSTTSTESFGGTTKKETTTETYVDPQANDEPEEELPF